jgi:predicted AAA+ superfamily ATPase
MNFLLQTERAPSASEDPAVLPIIGPVRVGKSTLIEHACDNQRVRNHFSQILRFSGDDLKDASLETLRDGGRMKHQNHGMGGGRTLIIIEVVLDIEESVWKILYSAARSCIVSGSKIIVASRSDKIASFGTTQPIRLQFFTQEAYWYFFKARTFGSTRVEDHPKLAAMAWTLPG